MDKRAAMTAEDAQSFEGKSLMNMAILIDTAQTRGCQCKPYVDWFTYKRWRAQGYQVQRGEHGVKLSTFVKGAREDENGMLRQYSHPWVSVVFCRCQVQKV